MQKYLQLQYHIQIILVQKKKKKKKNQKKKINFFIQAVEKIYTSTTHL